MSEPITIYCVQAHTWASRNFQPGDAMTIFAPSFVREMVASGRWALTEPAPAPVIEAEPPPAPEVVVEPTAPKRRGRRR